MITVELFSLASGAGSFVTPPVSIGDLTTFSVFVLFPGGGTLDGTLTLECSKDTVNANYVTITGSSQAVTGSTQHAWSAVGQGYEYVRMRWVYSSGAGNMLAVMQMKETNKVKGA